MTATTARARRDEAPERRCIVTRAALPAARMIRFVVGPDGQVVPDLKATLPGRGAWVTIERDLLEKAVAKGLFSRAFKRQVSADRDLGALVERQLEQAALGTLGMARKAGQAIAGFAKVEVALRSGRAGVLIHASDAADDGQRKLAAVLKAASTPKQAGDAAGMPVIREFTSEQLSLALGAAHVIHAVVLSGGLADAFAERTGRLRRFRHGGEPGTGEPGTTGKPVSDNTGERRYR